VSAPKCVPCETFPFFSLDLGKVGSIIRGI
jgi:hypothetical protein